MIAAGSYALVKIEASKEGERFMILYVEPDEAARPGYLWTSSEPMDEIEAVNRLHEMGVADGKVPSLFMAAREHFAAQRA